MLKEELRLRIGHLITEGQQKESDKLWPTVDQIIELFEKRKQETAVSRAQLHYCRSEINAIFQLSIFSDCCTWKRENKCLHLHADKCTYNGVMLTCIRNEKYEKALKELYKVYDKLEI